MIQEIHSHSVNTELLTEGGYVLDLGCRDFIFTQHMLNRNMKVISLDPYKGIEVPEGLENHPNLIFLNKACVGIKKEEKVHYHEYNDWGANSIFNLIEHNNSQYNEIDKYEVGVTTIPEIMEEFKIEKFELIKIDIEGSEYEILLNFPKNCTKQISVEFHDWLGLNPMEVHENFYSEIHTNQLSDYKILVRKKVPMWYGETYSDVLYILNEYAS